MAHTLKLSIWHFNLRERGSTHSLVNKEFFEKSFLEDGAELDKKTLFQEFVTRYIQSFDSKFYQDDNRTKAFATDDIHFSSFNNLVYGYLKGGLTGIERGVYDNDDIANVESTIDHQQVTTLPHYFLLWLPYKSDFGFLLLQNYTDSSLSKVFLEKLIKYFRDVRVTFRKNTYVSEERKKSFLDRSYVYKASIIKTRPNRSARKKFNEALADEEKLRFEINVTGFKQRVGDFLRNFTQLSSNLQDLDIENEDDYTTKLFYEDEAGRRSNAILEAPGLILPSIIIPESVKQTGSDFPDKDRIHEFCLTELDKIKSEIGAKVSSSN